MEQVLSIGIYPIRLHGTVAHHKDAQPSLAHNGPNPAGYI